MGWLPFRTKKVETNNAREAPASGIKGATIRFKGKDTTRADIQEELAAHREFNKIYETTVAGSIIDAEVNDLFSQGYAIQGEDEDEVARVREYLNAVNFVGEVKKLATESKIYGFGIAEIGQLGNNRHMLVAHSSYNIFPIMDDYGWLAGFKQIGAQDVTIAEWTPRQVVSLALRPNAATPGTGRSELAQAYQSIADYEDIRKANTAIILRMGYPSYEVKYEGDDGLVPADVIEGELADVGPGSAFELGFGGKLEVLNAQGVTQAAVYAETALQAVAVAMQVPRSMVGLADNSEATAKVTTAKYYNKIASEQAIIAATMQRDYFDRYVLPDLGIKPGSIQLFFNNPDPDAQLKRAQLLQIITSLDPTDPEYLLSVEEQAELWGKHPSPGEYDKAKIIDTIQDSIMHHIAQAIGGEDPSEPKPPQDPGAGE